MASTPPGRQRPLSPEGCLQVDGSFPPLFSHRGLCVSFRQPGSKRGRPAWGAKRPSLGWTSQHPTLRLPNHAHSYPRRRAEGRRTLAFPSPRHFFDDVSRLNSGAEAFPGLLYASQSTLPGAAVCLADRVTHVRTTCCVSSSMVVSALVTSQTLVPWLMITNRSQT